MKQHRLTVLITALALAATAGLAQYVEDSIRVGGNAVGSLAYNSQADVVYGRSQAGDVFFAIDCATNSLTASWPLNWPRYMVYVPVGNRAYCVHEGTGGADSVVVIDGTTHQPVKSIWLNEANQLVWDSIGNRIYVSCTENNRVGVIDCATDSVIGSIRVGTAPIRMLISPARRKLYVINYDFGSVSVVDMTADTVIKTVALGGTAAAGWYDPELDRCYVGVPNNVYVISCETDTVLYRIPIGTQTEAGAIGGGVPGLAAIASKDEGLLYVASRYTGLVKTSVQGGREPWVLTWNHDGSRLYCGNGSSDDVTVLTGDGFAVLRTLPVGDCPFSLAYSPVQRRLYVGHLNGRYVYVIKDTAAGIEEVAGRAAVRSALTASPSTFTSPVKFGGCDGGSVDVCDREGRIVRVLDRPGGAGAPCRWDGRDAYGRAAPAGVYVAVLRGDADARVKVVKVR